MPRRLWLISARSPLTVPQWWKKLAALPAVLRRLLVNLRQNACAALLREAKQHVSAKSPTKRAGTLQ